MQPSVARLNLAHSARADQIRDFVGTEPVPWGKRHGSRIIVVRCGLSIFARSFISLWDKPRPSFIKCSVTLRRRERTEGGASWKDQTSGFERDRQGAVLTRILSRPPDWAALG
jgi:hypothetical protein